MPELDKAKEALMDLGWSEYESRTYSALVQLGTATASKIAKNSNVPPNRVYQILSKLSERGTVKTTNAIGSTTIYEATDPDHVLETERAEISSKIDVAISALNELKERKQDTEIPQTFTISGRRELATYLQQEIKNATKDVFIAMDTVVELRHRELIDTLNSNDQGIEIRILTTPRGINDDYEIEIADSLKDHIQIHISEQEFSTIFLIVDDEVMIYSAYGYRDDTENIGYYGIYTRDSKTANLIKRSFMFAFDNGKNYREETAKAEVESTQPSN